jgi:hypothetical protein
MRLMPYVGNCYGMEPRERGLVTHAIRASRERAREVEGCRAANLVPLRPRNHRVITASHGASHPFVCRCN